MNLLTCQPKSANGLLLLVLHIIYHSCAAAQFSSHISINTPARSFSHGVGHPINHHGPNKSAYRHRNIQRGNMSLRHLVSASKRGYPKVRPSIPFTNEEGHRGNPISVTPWQYNSYNEVPIPLLPPSPYKVDSPDPESLWPEGLFLPPINAPRLLPDHYNSRRADDTVGEISTESKYVDPYLLEGSEAVAAVVKARRHGELYFHDIPHIESLLANQEIRTLNKLKPHRISSIRHTWPYNRP